MYVYNLSPAISLTMVYDLSTSDISIRGTFDTKKSQVLTILGKERKI